MSNSTSAVRLFFLFLVLIFARNTSSYAEDSIATVASGKASAMVPFTSSNTGHILVPARINGKGPFLFILDTGAERNILDNSVVKALGLGTRGKYNINGFGPKRADATQTNEVTIQLGDASLAEQKFLALDFSPIKAVLGQEVQGILGANVFVNFVVRVDPEQKTVRLSLPTPDLTQGNGRVIPLSFNKAHVPQVNGKIDGIEGTFDLDTGSGDGLLLYTPFVEKNHLREKFGSQLRADTDGGLGGKTRIQITPQMRLEIGGITVDLPVELAQENEGQTGVKDSAGTVGEFILSHITVTYDYSHKCVIFEQPSTAVTAPK